MPALHHARARPKGWSAELEVVAAACLDAPFPCPAAADGAPPLDWEAIRRLAAEHRVEGLVWQYLRTQERSRAPSEIVHALEQSHRRHALGFLARAAETLRLVEVLQGAGHPVIVLKGCAVAQAHYAPSPEMKHSFDIDILVAPASFNEAGRLLATCGYVREVPAERLPARAESMARHLLNAYEYVHATLGHRVELHHRLLTDPNMLAVPFQELLARSVEITLGGGVIRGLGPQDLLVYLSCHGAGHGYARLKWLADVARVDRSLDEAARAHAFTAAARLSCSRSLQLSLALLQRLDGLPNERRQLFSLPAVDGLVDTALGQIAAGVRDHKLAMRDLPAHLGRLCYLLALAEAPGSKRFMVLKHLVNVEDAAVLGLGDRWRVVYALAGRPLALARYCRRLVSGRR